MKALSQNKQINNLSFKDSRYPVNLRYIYDPPHTLYVRGEILPEDSLAVAIVGSRRASFYGLKNAQDLGLKLAAQGITIISGLAQGIDSAAHRGALKAGGRTIAVLGSGLNRIYPLENIGLAEEIADNGALISEYPLDTAPYSYNFPRRNRIISGLSLGVVVVEAAKKSGALITAHCALEQGREVFAIPGQIDSFTSWGAHDLIKQGAKLVQTIEDIIEELEALKALTKNSGQVQGESKINLPEDEQQIFCHLTSAPLHIDQILERLNLSYGRILTCLLKLEHKGLVKELPGKLFVKN